MWMNKSVKTDSSPDLVEPKINISKSKNDQNYCSDKELKRNKANRKWKEKINGNIN